MSTDTQKEQQGFTIVELMIATAIVGFMLLIVTAVFIRLGADYVKSVQLTRTQDNARNILDQITQKLEFSDAHFSANTIGTNKAVCIGTTRYSYILDTQAVEGSIPAPSNHVLWQDSISLGSPCNPVDVTSLAIDAAGGKELVPNHMRLNGLCVLQTGAQYQVNVWLAYADGDLLSPVGGSADDTCGGHHRTCTGGPGQEFCAVSELQTTVARRL